MNLVKRTFTIAEINAGAVINNANIVAQQSTGGEYAIRRDPAHNFISILTLDANDDPAQVTAGSLDAYVQFAEGHGYCALVEGSVDLTLCAGDTITPDGSAPFMSFDGNPWTIKLVGDSITAGDVTKVEVILQQNAS